LADGKVIETGNCFSVKETLINRKCHKKFWKEPTTSFSVKVGDGVPA
jgi:hypothetical protein